MMGGDDPMDSELDVFSRDTAELQSRAVSGTSITFFSQSIRIIISTVSQVVLARLLFPEDFGLLAMAAPIVSFIGLFGDLGFGQAIIQRETITRAQISILFWANIAMSIIIALIVFASGFVAARLYGQSQLVGIVAAFAVMIPFSAMLVHPTALLMRRMDFGVIAKNEIISASISVTVTIICAFKGMSYWSIVVGQAAQIISANLLAWMSAKWRPSFPKYNSTLSDDIKFGGNLTGANIASFVTMSGDDIIVGATAGPQALGFYDRSYRLVVQPVSQMINPIGRVAVPLLSRLLNDDADYRTSFLYMLKAVLIITVPTMLVCIVSGDAILSFVLGDRWGPAAPIFSWICVGGLASALHSSCYWLFTSQGRTRQLFQYTLATSLFSVVSFFVGSLWGAVGVAAGAAIVFVLISTPLMVAGSTRRGPVSSVDVARCLIPFAIAGGSTFVVLEIIQLNMSVSDLAEMIVVSTASFVMFVAVVALFPSGRADAHKLIELITSRWRKPK